MARLVWVDAVEKLGDEHGARNNRIRPIFSAGDSLSCPNG
jgi:hypothetical protein